MALARQHIDECVHGHKRCKRLSPPSPLLPTRLVDCSDPALPRLVLTTGERGEYIALSYVWGEEKPYQTAISSGVSIYEHGIASSILPQTVRDAISVTHALGFQYLWVDTLCIIQEDDADRRHEIGHMPHIYRHAHLTIFAASAKSASEGFLHQRPPQQSNVVLPFICPPPPPSSMGIPATHSTAQLQLGQVHLASIDSARASYSDELGVMATRAWCMQEYLMSPRALIFTPTRLLFSCRTTMQGVGNSFGSMDDEPQLPDMLFLRNPPVAKPGSKEWKDMHRAWTKVVMDYSRRRATFESDKLVACAAVAQQFAHWS
ncbi:HET-domain-containing protein [Trametes versicolor FP-101664 SS1]|uniref:HET-domain-containing protein n=1 Tax=Trametes versicolor (strain FP-101664) TaxID=717944 RepID=UPI00046214DE|nr:HET-domain-containing protein [Trametes versicolor FP-101664 SS1]EIW54647.1 HET-domain-containing protein [Trametes versicolor FP-101664 SS1]